jgi:hypothetical protein
MQARRDSRSAGDMEEHGQPAADAPTGAGTHRVPQPPPQTEQASALASANAHTEPLGAEEAPRAANLKAQQQPHDPKSLLLLKRGPPCNRTKAPRVRPDAAGAGRATHVSERRPSGVHQSECMVDNAQRESDRLSAAPWVGSRAADIRLATVDCLAWSWQDAAGLEHGLGSPEEG